MEIFFLSNKKETLNLLNLPSAEITSISGMGMTKKNFAKNENPKKDGTEISNIKHSERNIIFNYVMNGNENQKTRQLLFSILGGKESGKIIYKDEELKDGIEIKAYCEDIICDSWTNKVILSIYFSCPFPFFNSVNKITNDIQIIAPLFYFPLVLKKEGIPVGEIKEASEIILNNSGQMETPCQIEIKIKGDVTNPIVYDYTNNKFFGLDETFKSGQTIFIDTTFGNKSVYLIDVDGTEKDLFYSIKNGSEFLQIEKGDNTFFVSAESGNEFLKTIFNFNTLYFGVD